MRILIDTNIFIYREADQVLTENQQILSRMLHEIGALQIVHPLSVSELKKNPNPEKKEDNALKNPSISSSGITTRSDV